LQLLLAATFGMARTSLSSPAEAEAAARQLALVLQSIGSRPQNGVVWKNAASLLEIGFSTSTTAADIAKLLQQSNADDIFLTSGMLAASLKPEQKVQQAVAAHITSSMRLLAQPQAFMHMHRRLLLPFLFEYWSTLASRSGFLFRSPIQLRESIASAMLAPVASRAQRLLREIVWQLGLQVPPQVAAWLGERSPKE